MAPTYTTIANGSNPNIIPGVVFDWGTSKITIPSGVDSINSQQLYDTVASQAQDGSNGSPGQAYPPIAEAGGKIQIGVGSYTGVITSLLGSWKIVTAKTSGSFTVTDIYIKGSSAEPFDRVAGVAYAWEKTVNPTLQTISTGSGLSPTQDSWLAALYATLQSPQSAGVFSSSALANVPAGNTSAIASAVWGYSGVIASNILNQTSSNINSSLTGTRIFRMSRELGSEQGVSATVLDALDTNTPGYLRTSAGDRKVITKNPDGSVTIALDGSTGDTFSTALFTMFF
jgi:hypothetical protein